MHSVETCSFLSYDCQSLLYITRSIHPLKRVSQEKRSQLQIVYAAPWYRICLLLLSPYPDFLVKRTVYLHQRRAVVCISMQMVWIVFEFRLNTKSEALQYDHETYSVIREFPINLLQQPIKKSYMRLIDFILIRSVLIVLAISVIPAECEL